jgi:hypothetical protein
MTNDINAKIPRYRSADTGAGDLSSTCMHVGKYQEAREKRERNSLDRQMRTQTDTENRKWKNR